MNAWIYQDKEFEPSYADIKQYEGFVYRIVNLETGRSYIGKKSMHAHRTPKGSIRKKTVESDWRNYFSSSDELKKDVKSFGKDQFKREILILCYYKKQQSYWETYYQWKFDVLNDEMSYNSNIGGTFYKNEKHIYFCDKKRK